MSARKLLLATDLTSRSDRAMDRALWLNSQCGSELVALHVLDSHTGATELAGRDEERAREALQFDLSHASPPATIAITRGDPAEATLRYAREHACELIIAGVARSDRLFGVTLGKVADRLVKSPERPVLLVTERARGPYQRIIVASDFSEPSRASLAYVAAMFPTAQLTVFHAFDASAAAATTDRHRYVEQFHQAARDNYHTFVKDLPERARLEPLLRHGDPDTLLQDIVVTRRTELVVLATHGRGKLYDALVGSVAHRILGRLPCDALVVPHR